MAGETTLQYRIAERRPSIARALICAILIGAMLLCAQVDFRAVPASARHHARTSTGTPYAAVEEDRVADAQLSADGRLTHPATGNPRIVARWEITDPRFLYRQHRLTPCRLQV